MRRCGELDSIAEFHSIADHAGNHECFQIFERYLGRPFGADAQAYVFQLKVSAVQGHPMRLGVDASDDLRYRHRKLANLSHPLNHIR
jgi:hypothetical protein